MHSSCQRAVKNLSRRNQVSARAPFHAQPKSVRHVLFIRAILSRRSGVNTSYCAGVNPQSLPESGYSLACSGAGCTRLVAGWSPLLRIAFWITHQNFRRSSKAAASSSVKAVSPGKPGSRKPGSGLSSSHHPFTESSQTSRLTYGRIVNTEVRAIAAIVFPRFDLQDLPHFYT
jgi:hypothetical protein